ncbi:hypothetical protein ACHAW5_000268 [Stephanodiscus triporus]|uniref:NADH dehydrogenase [ubiquinone] iron-sulfur protein 5 n=1 Tax=Stephanodiscus triporus TaxID=2934178 RepID=A0ABD3MNN1_9STRA
MSSGHGINGSVDHCYPFFAEFKECLKNEKLITHDDGPRKLKDNCRTLREDYLECMHAKRKIWGITFDVSCYGDLSQDKPAIGCNDPTKPWCYDRDDWSYCAECNFELDVGCPGDGEYCTPDGTCGPCYGGLFYDAVGCNDLTKPWCYGVESPLTNNFCAECNEWGHGCDDGAYCTREGTCAFF